MITLYIALVTLIAGTAILPAATQSITGMITAITDLRGDLKPGAPGKFMSISGMNLCAIRSDVPLQANVASTLRLPTVLGGCQVLVDGSPVQLSFSWTNSSDGETQINFRIPENISGERHEVIVTQVEGLTVTSKSPPYRLVCMKSSPMFFSYPGIPINLWNASRNNGLVLGNSPAHPGDILTAYSTGLAQGNATIAINGRSVEPQYTGPQGTFPGLDQYNFQIPLDNVPLGGAIGTLTITVGEVVQTFEFGLANSN